MASFQASLFGGGEPALNSEASFTRLQLDGASWVETAPDLVLGSEALFEILAAEVAWRRGRRRMYDRVLDDPRLTRWYAEGEPLPHGALLACRDALEARYGARFSTLGLNYYRDGQDSVAFHRDRELRHLDDTLVAILSLGSARPFLLRPRGGGRSHRFKPTSGSMLVMGGGCQTSWEHGVPKAAAGGPRISATFRWSSGRGAPVIM